MEPLTDAEREARVAARVDELCKRLQMIPYREKNMSLSLGERLNYFGGPALAQLVREGHMGIRDLVAEMRSVYDEVAARRKSSTVPELLRYVHSLPDFFTSDTQPSGPFSPQKVGWLAVRDLLDEDQYREVHRLYDAPSDIPRASVAFWRLGRKQGLTRRHDPRRLFEELARMELEPEKHDVGRKRRQRAHKGVNRRGNTASLCYSNALLQALQDKTGVPQRTIYRLLRDVDYQMPPEWTIV